MSWGDFLKKVAIDLTWVRHNKVGGTESCVRNLLNGLATLENSNICFILLVTKDNQDSFMMYRDFNIFKIVVCDTVSEYQLKRLFWQNTKMGNLLNKLGINICLEPIYSMPFLCKNKIKYVVTIHDLQAIHYPKYFNILRNIWMRISWWYSIHFSDKIIAISRYVKHDILKHYKIKSEKVKVIYDAIEIITTDIDEKSEVDVLNKYELRKKEFYYTVSSLLPHKNLKTLIKAMALLKESNSCAFKTLVISGIGGKSKTELEELISQSGLKSNIVFTDFISNQERNILYKNCKAFLFPSIFEGFGMPPIEALSFGTPVITTNKTSIPEVTHGLCRYVKEPLSPHDWAEEILYLRENPCIISNCEIERLIDNYSPNIIARKYSDLFKEV